MRRSICTMMTILLLGSLCACQSTPEGDVVANRGDGVMEQRISEAQEQEKQAQWEQSGQKESPAPTPTPQPYAHPDSWELEMDLTNFYVHIAIEEGGIQVPDAPYPVVRLSQSSFSEHGEILSALLTRIMGTPTGKRQGVHCYEDYVAMMEECVRGAFDFNTNSYRAYFSDEQAAADRQMAEYAEMLKTALHREEFDEDGSLVTEVNTEYTYCGENGKLWYVRIGENRFTISSAHDTGTGESWISWKPDFPGGPTPPPIEATVTLEQAKAEADKVLEDFSGMEWELEKAERGVVRADKYFAIDPVEWAAEGYLLTYTRRIENTSFFNYWESQGDRLHFEEAAYAATLQFETLTVFADENGVQCVTWTNPIHVEDTVAGYVELLAFEQIQENFVNLLKAGLSWADERPPSNGKLNATRIAWVRVAKLAYAYVQEKNNPGKFLAVPTWFFLYRTEVNKEGSPTVIALNAVDGTRIGW